MLLSFRVQNSRSIVDLTIPLTYAEKKAPNGYREMEMLPFLEKGGQRTVPCLALYGPNASGKSNIVRAFEVFLGIVRNRFSDLYSDFNKLHELGETTVFIIKFIGKYNDIYTYRLEIDTKQIVSEELSQGSKLLYSVHNQKLNTKIPSNKLYNEEKLKNIFAVECLDSQGHQQVTYLTVLGKNYAGLNVEVSEVYTYLIKQIDVNTGSNLSFMSNLKKLTRTKGNKTLQDTIDEIAMLLRKFDIDINRMEYRTRSEGDTVKTIKPPFYEMFIDRTYDPPRRIDIYTYHNDVRGNEVQFDFSDESGGTQRAARLLAIILDTLKRGGVLVFDELGMSLHPLILVEIVRLFKDRRYNRNGAQLIFTTHTTDILDQELLRVSEIGIVNKTLEQGTQMVRISDFDGIRNVTNFRKQYLTGNFTGIPFPYI